MKKVLLTGGCGFIGRHAIPFLLERGYEVHAVCHPDEPALSTAAGLLWHHTDLLDEKGRIRLMESVSPTHLLHFAWVTTPGVYWTSLENLRWLSASAELVARFVQGGGRRAVLAGTCAEYDWSSGYCSEEETLLRPTTLYGICKKNLSEILPRLCVPPGCSWAWGRIFFVYGPYEHPQRLVPSIIRSLLAGTEARCTDGNQVRDFLYVADAAEAFISLLDSAWCGPVNIASGRPVVLKDIMNTLAGQMERTDLLRLGAVPRRAGDPPVLTADVRRLQRETGWTPKYDMESGLRETIAWWARESKK